MPLINRYDLKIYQAGLKFVLIVACKRALHKDVTFAHSLDKGLYVQINTDKEITANDINLIQEEMDRIIQADYPINKKIVIKKDAYDYYQKMGYVEKAGNINILNNKTVTLYELLGNYNYFMSEMPDRTGYLNKYKLNFLGKNDLLLSYPTDSSGEIPAYKPQDKIFESFTDYDKWIKTLNVSYVSELNEIIAHSKIKDFIKKNDIMMDNELYSTAVKIKESNAKIILLGGPSSSGKTTSTRKLALFLSTFGLNPIYLGLDDYFKEREDCPKDEKGEYDFECLDAIDLELFNKQLKSILSKEEVSVPSFNFLTGKKEYKGRTIKLKENDLILIEGLHCLNEELTKEIPRQDKLKIYISPFTPLGIDRHNHISTIDIRLIRRMVRDSWSRGFTPEVTFKLWTKVRAGETKYVFPFTTEADIILNTAYIYEIGVLKVYAEPLLHSIKPDSPYYNEVRRILNFMQMFLPIPSEYVNKDNVLREFIGGSYFEER